MIYIISFSTLMLVIVSGIAMAALEARKEKALCYEKKVVAKGYKG